jgi:hypothetical protein
MVICDLDIVKVADDHGYVPCVVITDDHAYVLCIVVTDDHGYVPYVVVTDDHGYVPDYCTQNICMVICDLDIVTTTHGTYP